MTLRQALQMPGVYGAMPPNLAGPGRLIRTPPAAHDAGGRGGSIWYSRHRDRVGG